MSSARFFGILKVVPYGILGTQLTRVGECVMRGTTPGPGTAIIDPAGLNYIRQGPAGAGGAAGEIYRWLGIANDTSFPDPVREAIEAPLTAKFHAYDAKLCVHVCGWA